MPHDELAAFAPGRVNLIGEHTDYNDGLALPFAIAAGVTVRARRSEQPSITAIALDLGERDSFLLGERARASGWRAFVRGLVTALEDAGVPLGGAQLEISSDVARGAGMSSSAALEVSLCLALLALSGCDTRRIDKREIARLCARVESDWVGAETGLLDQLASLYGQPEAALLIDFAGLVVEPVPLKLDGWRLVVVDSGERHALASSGYNERRAECRQAAELLGLRSLRAARVQDLEALPLPLRARAHHVLVENQRVLDAAAALRANDPAALGALLNASHESLRDYYDVSTAAVERAVQRLLDAGASGARLIGGGFGGSVLGLFAPECAVPAGAREVTPGPGARLIA